MSKDVFFGAQTSLKKCQFNLDCMALCMYLLYLFVSCVLGRRTWSSAEGSLPSSSSSLGVTRRGASPLARDLEGPSQVADPALLVGPGGDEGLGGGCFLLASTPMYRLFCVPPKFPHRPSVVRRPPVADH